MFQMRIVLPLYGVVVDSKGVVLEYKKMETTRDVIQNNLLFMRCHNVQNSANA